MYIHTLGGNIQKRIRKNTVLSSAMCFGNTELYGDTAAMFMFLPGAALQRLRLIQDHVLPLDSLEVLDVLDHQLVACDHHVERCVLCVKGFLLKHRQTHNTGYWREENDWTQLNVARCVWHIFVKRFQEFVLLVCVLWFNLINFLFNWDIISNVWIFLRN